MKAHDKTPQATNLKVLTEKTQIQLSLFDLPSPVVTLPASSFCNKILRLEDAIRQLPELLFETRHHFGPGVYARELFIPAGGVITGKIHRHHHLNILAQGRITVVTEDGAQTLQAPAILASPPGTKRAGYAHEDTVWITVHGTDETDLERLESEFIVTDPVEWRQLADAARAAAADTLLIEEEDL